MRQPTAGEVVLLARVIMRQPGCCQMSCAAGLLQDAETAARHVAVTGCAHPDFGDGSLAARCLAAQPLPEPMADAPEFLAALGVAAIALRRHLWP